jgi:membrane protease YdiL (CAAX protease family)
VNDSPSTISPAWPTRWPRNSFTGFWTWALAAAVAAIFLLAFVLGLKTSGAPVRGLSPLVLDLSLLLQFVLEGLLVLGVLAALPALSKFSLRELGFRAPTGRTVGISVLGALAMALVANGGASLIDYLLHSKHEQDVVQIFKNLHDPLTIAAFVAFAVFFAPFAEETLFRVFFFNLGLRYGGFWTGAVLSGMLFGIAHGDLIAAVPLALGGIVLAYVYYRTRNAFASMISHGLFNAFSILALLLTPSVTR